VFAQNNGVIQLTGVQVVMSDLDCDFIDLIGLFPACRCDSSCATSSLGGAVMVMFGAVAASGINILSGIHLDRRALIIAISLALGLVLHKFHKFLNIYLNYLKIFSVLVLQQVVLQH
jgi:xanthine permease XanP